jgi:hypothetical protein
MIKALILGAKAAATSANPWRALFKMFWKPVLGLILLVLLILWIRDGGYDKAKAEDAKVIAELRQNLTAAQQARDGAVGANQGLAASEQAARIALAACTLENTRVVNAGKNAVADAMAEKEAEARAADAWEAKYRGVLDAPVCKDALAMMAKACPVGSY